MPLFVEFSIITGENDFNGISDFVVYPNPATKILNIQWPSSLRTLEPRIIQIMDITGRVCYQKNFPEGSEGVEIEIDNLAVGSYFVKISQKEMIYQKCFIISR